jgi:type VI protein secretion system component VasK
LDELAFEHDDLELLVRDLRAIPPANKVQAGDSLGAIQRLLESQNRDIPSPDVVEVRLSFFGENYVIDRRKVRTSALLDSLERFGKSATDFGNGSGIPEALFFRPEDYGRTHSWLPATTIPNGVILENAVLWRYTGEGFDAAIRKPFERLTELADRVTCQGEDGQPAKGEILDGIERFAATYVSAYLVAYEAQWHRLFDGFRVNATDDKHLADVLLLLTRPSSPQLAMLREVQRQTTLTVDDAAPWAKSLATVKEAFSGLSGGLDEKAFGEYQGLLLEVANAAAEANAEDTTKRNPKSPKGDPVESFLQGLTGLARLVAFGVKEPKTDVLSRVETWLDTTKIPSDLRRPFLQPIESAYSSGRMALTKAFQSYWERERAKLNADWLASYPFEPKAANDAPVLAIKSWLQPPDGRFFVEVAPVCDWIIDNSKALGVSVPLAMPEVGARLRALSKILFDSKGDPSPIRVKWEAVPFTTPTIKGTSLVLGDVYERYYNDVPRTISLLVPWATDYVASIKVELVGATRGGETTLVVPSRKSPWSFYHLLDAARIPGGAEKTPKRMGGSQLTQRTWTLEETNPRGASSVWGAISYRVCAPALGDERAKEVLRCD